MSRSRQFLLGLGTGYLQAALLMGCNLWLARFLLLRLGETDFGGWLVLGQLLLYADLLDLGVVALLPREVAAAGAADGAAAVRAVVSQARALMFRQTPLALAAAGLFWWLGSASAPGMGTPALATALVLVVLFPSRVYPAILQGLQDLGAVAGLNLLGCLLNTATTVALVVAGLGVWALVVGWTVHRVFLAVAYWLRVRLAFPWVLQAPPADGPTAQLASRGLWATAGTLAQNLMNGTELLILSRLLDPTAVVVFVCTSKLGSVFAAHVCNVALSAEPAMSEIRAGGDRARLIRVVTAIRQLTLLLSGLIACVVLTTNEGFVVWWVGAEQYGGLALTALLVILMLVRHTTFTLAHTLFCFRYEKMLTRLYLAEAVVTVSTTVACVKGLGVVGAPLGLISGVVLVGWPTYIFYIRRELGVTALGLARAHAGWLGGLLLVAVPLTVAAQRWQPRGVAELSLTGVLTCLLYSLVMWPVVRSSPLADYVRPRLAGLLRRFRGAKAEAPGASHASEELAPTRPIPGSAAAN